MKRYSPTLNDLAGKRFGKLVVLGRSNKRGNRGARTVPLWECQCDCGNIVYKATDTLTNSDVSMCNECAKKYASQKMRENAGFVDGTQLSKLQIKSDFSTNSSGIRGVYFDRRSGKWRARLRFKGKLMNFGSYTSLNDAIEARKKAEESVFAEFLESHK